MGKNLYKILGVSSDVNNDLMKSAYRSLGKLYHPDIYQGDKEYAQEKMKEINLAYDVLSNENKRKEYDKKYNFQSESSFEKKEKETFKYKEEEIFKYKEEEIYKNDNTFWEKYLLGITAEEKAHTIAYFKRIFFIFICITTLPIIMFTSIDFMYIINATPAQSVVYSILKSIFVGLLFGLFFYISDFKDNKIKGIIRIVRTVILSISLMLIIGFLLYLYKYSYKLLV